MHGEFFPQDPKREANVPKAKPRTEAYDPQFIVNVLKHAQDWPANTMASDFGMSKPRFIEYARQQMEYMREKVPVCAACMNVGHVHTCCPFQIHQAGHCDCIERHHTEVP